jgi:hypothetical protein
MPAQIAVVIDPQMNADERRSGHVFASIRVHPRPSASICGYLF